MKSLSALRPVGSSVLFVCMGNICRSPTAEGVFRHNVGSAGLASRIHIDSAGTGDWHVGHPPDRRAVAAARRRGYDLASLRARQVTVDDFTQFGWILAMDRTNLRALEVLRPRHSRGHLGLLLDFAPKLGLAEVPDPFYDADEAFEHVLDLAEHASHGLLAVLRDHLET